MSVEIPKCAIVFGAVTPPQGDVVDLRVHLGCTKEVSSFELVLQNWDKKYSPGGTTPINVGMDGHIDIGRGSNVPQIITCRVEKINCQSPDPLEHYILVSGRCWGEKLFRRVVTKKYTNQKGEAIVKDLIDNYVGLSHTRDSAELIQDTDTTYTSLEYEDTPVWDILKYIAESSDKDGVIGFDFIVAPDGKFEFFKKNSRNSLVDLTDKIEVSEYRKDIHRVRNKIMIYGLADKSMPLDKDAWTESVTPEDGAWSSIGGEPPTFDTTNKVKGTGSIKVHGVQAYYEGGVFTLNAGKEVNANLYPILSFFAALQQAFRGDVDVSLWDTANKAAWKHINIAPGEWRKTDLKVGLANEGDWIVDPGFDWTQIKKVRIDCWFSGVGSGYFWIDALYFGGRRYAAVREDVASQNAYGLRELTETDEELVSDNECDLRAKALLDYFKDPAEYLTVRSTVIDYGLTPSLAGDKIPIELPNENVDSDFRIESMDYHVDLKVQTLEVVYELGKVPPQLADYLYGLRATTVTVEKLARTKLGKKGIPSVNYGGGMGAHHSGHETGDDTGAQWPSEDEGGWDKITGWISPKFLGPFDDSAAIIKFRTQDKAGTTPVDHQFNPSDDQHGVFGSETFRWKETHSMYGYLYNSLRLKVAAEENVKALLDLESLQFGAGGASAPDIYLKRLSANTFEIKAEKLLPNATNILEIGGADKLIKNLFTKLVTLSDDGIVQFGADAWFKRLGPGFIECWRYLVPKAGVTCKLGTDLDVWSEVHCDNLYSQLIYAGADYLLIVTAGRVLQNVLADAAIITSGQFPLARMPRGDAGKYIRGYGVGFDPMYATIPADDIPGLPASKITSGRFGLARLPEGSSGYVLEAQGAGFDPMYVNPNGRYTPAGHNHAAGNITSGVLDEARCPNVYSGQITFNGGIVTNSVNCANWSATDIIFENKFRITESEKLGFPKGLAFLNPRGKILMFLDSTGNIEILGKVKQRSSRLKMFWEKLKRRVGFAG